MAADLTVFTKGFVGLGKGLFNAGIIILGGVGLGGFGLWYMYQRRYAQYEVVIWERDGFGQLREVHDKGGIFVDSKTKNKRFFLKYAKVGLKPDNIPYVTGKKGKKRVYLMRKGLKNFIFIRVKPVGEDNVMIKVGEEDVNWAINSYERQKKVFQHNPILQYLPFAIVTLAIICVLLIFFYFYRRLPELTQTAQVIASAVEASAQACSGTAIIE